MYMLDTNICIYIIKIIKKKTESIKRKYYKEKKCLIGPFDMLIGAHAKSLHMMLVTNNTKEFGRITGLKTENWV